MHASSPDCGLVEQLPPSAVDAAFNNDDATYWNVAQVQKWLSQVCDASTLQDRIVAAQTMDECVKAQRRKRRATIDAAKRVCQLHSKKINDTGKEDL